MRHPLARAAFAAALGAVVLVVSAVLVRDGAGRAEAVTGQELDALFPAYPGSQMLSMGDVGAVNGQPFRMAYFTTRATPEQVTRYYESYWRSQRLFVQGDGNDDAAHLSSLNGVDGTQRSITAHREGDRLMVFCAIGRPGAHQAPAVDDLPRMVDSKMEDRIELDGQTTLTYVVGGSLEANRRELGLRFEEKGWKPLADTTKVTPHGVMMQFEKSGRVAMAALAREGKDRSVAVQIHAMSADVARGGAVP